MAFYSQEQLDSMGFKYLGKNVKLSDKASFYNTKNISIGDNSRIDDFCVISAGDGSIEIGKYVHIAVYCSLMGSGKITMDDFSGLSSKVAVYSSNDDYSGEALTNPSVPDKYTNVTSAPITLKKHVIIGSGTIILPGVTIEEGASIGSLSLVNRDCKEFTVYAGTPAKPIKERSRKLLEIEKQLLNDQK